MAIVFAPVAASGQEVITKAIDSINQSLTLKEYEKAYSYTSFILRYYRGKDIPPEALEACSRSTAAWAQYLAGEARWTELLGLEQALAAAPDSVRSQILAPVSRAKAEIARAEADKARREEEARKSEAEKARLAQIEQALEAERVAEAAKEEIRRKERQEAETREAALMADRLKAEEAQRAQIDRLLEESRKIELEKEKLRDADRKASDARQADLEAARLEAEQRYREEMNRMFEFANRSSSDNLQTLAKTNTSVIVGLGILAAFVMLGIIVVVLVSLRQQKMQHEQFKSTLMAMQSMRTAPPAHEFTALPFLTQDADSMRYLPGNRPLLIEGAPGSNQNGAGPGNGLAASSGSSGVAGVKELLITCQRYGEEIDKVTGRRNASRLVADLVYKVSRQLGYSEQDAILYFAVGLVYDIGFLNVDQTILRAEHISESSFETIKTHTKMGLAMVFFVDESNREVFKDGVSKHHENLDGSGYPFGLKDNEIPYVARVLRVIESYVALISSRDYHQIKDRESAIRELASNPAHYDQDIVKALDSIV